MATSVQRHFLYGTMRPHPLIGNLATSVVRSLGSSAKLPRSASTLLDTDPLHYGDITLDHLEEVKLDAGEHVIKKLNVLVKENEPISVIHGTDNTMKHFSKVFPEIVDTNEIGKLTEDSFALWEPGKNNITIGFDDGPEVQSTLDVYIGGPPTAVAAALHAKSDSPKNILYCHDGRRGASNWKGSASYMHIRDSIPVYYWPDNHGAYTIYAAIKHFFHKRFAYDRYMSDVTTNPNWNKLRLNLKNLLREPSIFPLLMKNQWYSMLDVGLHVRGTEFRSKKKQTANATIRLASLTNEVFKHLKTEDEARPLLMESRDSIGDAIYIFTGTEAEVEESEAVVSNLKSIVNNERNDDILENTFLSREEIAQKGYNLACAKKAAIFPNDGQLPPYLGEELEKIIQDGGGEVSDRLQLERILVRPQGNDDVKATKIVWKDTKTGDQHITPINSLYLSLGPSMKSLIVDSDDEITLQNILWGRNLMSKIIWASGSSIVFLVRVDCAKINPKDLRCFRDYIGGNNKHIVRLAEKDVQIGEKKYKYFAMQTTGGGHFPSKDAHAETALNIFQANVVPMLNLDREGVEYDIVQARSCARGVCAQNALRLTAPASNMVMIYGMGGIGMSTMAGNGLLMQALMKQRQMLSNGTTNPNEYKNNLANGNFGRILHWNKSNPFNEINFAQFTDNVDNPKVLADLIGVRRQEATARGATLE